MMLTQESISFLKKQKETILDFAKGTVKSIVNYVIE